MGGKLNWSSASHLAANPAPSVSCSGWLTSTAVQSPSLSLFTAFLYSPGTWYFWPRESGLEPSTLQLSAQSTWAWQLQGSRLCCSLGCWVRMLHLFQLILPSHFSWPICVKFWKDVYTFKTQPGMKLMLGGTSITAQIIRQSVYWLSLVRTAQHQSGRLISIPDAGRALSEGWANLCWCVCFPLNIHL